MKLSLLAFAVSASASKFNLRATDNEADSVSSFTNARVAVFGLKSATSTEDVDIISESLVAAFNQMFATTEMQAVTFEPKTTASLPTSFSEHVTQCRRCKPDDDSIDSALGTMVLGRVGFGPCRKCAPDDDSFELGRAIHGNVDLQTALNNKFCSMLRASGSKNLAGARDCALSFVDMTEGDAEQAQISLKGLLHDFSDKDALIFNKAVVAAYNEAFSFAGYSMGFVEAVADIDMEPLTQCRRCPPDDDTTTAAENTVILARVFDDVAQCRRCKPDDDNLAAEAASAPTCRHCSAASTEVKIMQCRRCKPDDDTWANFAPCRRCPPDDDTLEAKQAKHVAAHEAMEDSFKKALCAKLRNSGSANFANVHDCDFGFVYGAVGSEAKLLASPM